MAILLNILLVIYVLVAFLMMFVILMQRPKSEGLGAAFGGGVTENLFGAQTTNVLVKITGWLAGIFFFLTFVLSIMYAHRSGASSGLRQELLKTAQSPAPATPIVPQGSPAVGPPNTVTNPTPGGADSNQGNQPTAADQAVGVTAPGPEASVAPSASASPKP